MLMTSIQWGKEGERVLEREKAQDLSGPESEDRRSEDRDRRSEDWESEEF